MRKIVPGCLILICCMIISSGCLPTNHTRETTRMDGYLGGPISTMVQEMGTPTLSSKSENGNWVYVWRGCRVVMDWHGRDHSRYCEITARSDEQGRVKHWEWWGNECPLESVSSGCTGMLWWQP